jgi:uncharacterized protein (TIGR03000 family)
MFQKTLLFGGMLLLAGTGVLVTPAPGHAQHGGGGGHVGAAHFGGYRGGAYDGARSGAYRHGGYRYNRPYARYGSRFYPYGSYDYDPYYETYPYFDDSSPVGPTEGVSTTFQAQPDISAHIIVRLPADARIWFDDSAMTAKGPVRQFDSPPLVPGSRYSYNVRAQWEENGHKVTQTQQVPVSAGQHVEVDFPVTARTAETTSVAPTR